MADELENLNTDDETTEGGTTEDESTETETDVSKIPYPEGTAPPVLDDAKHAEIQFTLTEAVISAAGDVDAETVANMRKGTAKEAMEIRNGATYSSLSEALAGSLGSGGGEG